MSSNNYIPRNNGVFCDWVKTMTAHASANHERWGVEPFDLGGKLERLEKLAYLCTTSKRTAEDTVERNTLRRAVGTAVLGGDTVGQSRRCQGLPTADRAGSCICKFLIFLFT